MSDGLFSAADSGDQELRECVQKVRERDLCCSGKQALTLDVNLEDAKLKIPTAGTGELHCHNAVLDSGLYVHVQGLSAEFDIGTYVTARTHGHPLFPAREGAGRKGIQSEWNFSARETDQHPALLLRKQVHASTGASLRYAYILSTQTKECRLGIA